MDNSNAKTATSAQRRVRVEYSAGLADKIDKLMDSQTQLAIQISTLQASMMPRHEIDAELEKRVTLGTYIADKAGLEQRIGKLEQAPQGAWNKAGILISSGVGCFSGLVGASGLVVGIISIIVSHPLK